MYSRPMNFFRPHTPNALAISVSVSARTGNSAPILSQNLRWDAGSSGLTPTTSIPAFLNAG